MSDLPLSTEAAIARLEMFPSLKKDWETTRSLWDGESKKPKKYMSLAKDVNERLIKCRIQVLSLDVRKI